MPEPQPQPQIFDLDADATAKGAELYRAQELSAQKYQDWVRKELVRLKVNMAAAPSVNHNPWTGRVIVVPQPAAAGTGPG